MKADLAAPAGGHAECRSGGAARLGLQGRLRGRRSDGGQPQRIRGIAALDDRLALERLIAELSSAFINLPAYPELFPWILDQPLSGEVVCFAGEAGRVSTAGFHLIIDVIDRVSKLCATAAHEGRDEERTRTRHGSAGDCGVDMAALSRAQCGIGAIVLALAGSSGTAEGQSLQVDPQPQRPAFTLAPGAAEAFVAPAGEQPAPAWYTEGRACEGCARRRVGRSIFQLTMVNVFYGLGNLARGQVTARVTPKTWWANMEQGWVWDLDDFTVNQFGHPYQGNNYFTTGRANGLNFYESAALTAFGSSTWEYFGETNHASLNDFINTTLGGIALGEAFHRTAWLIRDTRATGSGRLWREIAATVLDPLTGYNRFVSGDASLVTDKPPDMVPSALGAVSSLGVLWRGSDTNAFSASGQPFLEVDLLYGDLEAGRTRTPFDAMTTRLRFGGGGGISEARVRGRLVGQPLNDGRLQLTAIQSYGYEKNDAYATGSQSFEVAIGGAHDFSSKSKLRVMGWGGLTVLGAIDSLPLGVEEIPEEGEEEEGGGGQGVSEGPRFYDYGPGANFGAVTQFTRGGRQIAVFNYEARHIYSLDGVRVNHFLQKTRFDLQVPLKGRLGIGAAAEYFSRKSYYQDPDRTVKGYSYPQVRAYFTWSQR